MSVRSFRKLGFKSILLIFIILIIVSLVFLLVNSPKSKPEGIIRKVEGFSMNPTLENGQNVLVDYNYYKKRDPKRGDIVIIKLKTRDFEDVKRIIALPEDRLVFGNNSRIYLNGKLLEEEYVRGESFRKQDLYLLLKQLEYYNNTIPTGYYFILGDNRIISYDSTNYGLILRENIVGKVVSLNVSS